MLHLRAHSIQHPPKHELNILNHIARDLNMPHIRRMIQRANTILLHQTRSIEIVDKRLQILVYAVGGGLVVSDGVVDGGVREVFG